MNDIIQNLEANATNGKENFCYISEKQLNAMKELSKREAKENKQIKDKLSKIETLIINHNRNIGDIYYKYNSRFLKSELKQRILEIVYEVSE